MGQKEFSRNESVESDKYIESDKLIESVDLESKAFEKILDTTADGIERKCKPSKLPLWDESVLVRKSYEEVVRTCRVGDCIFTYGKGLFSQGPQMFQDCNVSHVVQIYRIEEDEEGERKVHYIESSIHGNIGNIKNGVQTHDNLRKCLENHAVAWLVSLDEDSQKILEEKNEEFLGWQKLQIGKKYSVSQAISSVFSDKKKWPILHKFFFDLNQEKGPSDKTYFCSGLVCAAFVHIGVIETTKEKFQWNLCTPKEMLKLDIWKNEVIQFHGYETTIEGETIMVAPILEKEFRSMTPNEWNVFASEL